MNTELMIWIHWDSKGKEILKTGSDIIYDDILKIWCSALIISLHHNKQSNHWKRVIPTSLQHEEEISKIKYE